MRTTSPRAIGIVRVSETKGRQGESFHSPDTQRKRISEDCERNGRTLTEVHEELDVSGGKPLNKRPGLLRAVEAVEAGEADVIIVAYIDRLVRSMRVQDEVIDRVERAGGEIFTLDHGQITNGNAAKRLEANIIGSMAQYFRELTAEKSREAQVAAVARGVVPWPNIPPGYERGDDGVLVPDKTAPAVGAAFELRADGATVAAVREYLRAHGVNRSYHGTMALLASRVVLGEIHFGTMVNLKAHPAIVERGLWLRVQRVSIPRGRKPKSDRLLARLGVLRCASCGGRMVVGTQRANGHSYPFYRCGHVREDCSERVTISAETVESIVVDAVREALSDAEGRASAQSNVREAEAALGRSQAALDGAIRAFASLGDEPAAIERLGDLRAVRDAAQEHLDQLGGQRATVTINAATDWGRLTLDEQRTLIRATVESVLIAPDQRSRSSPRAPGRGRDRVTVELVGQ